MGRGNFCPWHKGPEEQPPAGDAAQPQDAGAGEEFTGPWTYGPPWRHWRGGPPWQGKRRFFFWRFARFMAFLMVVFVAGLAGLSFLLSRIWGRPGIAALGILMIGAVVMVFAMLAAGGLAARSFARSMEPLARVMSAADAVSEGDLSVRVPENAPGEFGRLQVAFNRMVTELQRTDQQRRNLTADVAHELRTPLHVIQGNLEGILDGVYEPDPGQIELLLDETRQLSRLVEDLRTLSLAEAGQLPLRFEPIDAGELLEDVVTSFSGQAETAGVDLAAAPTPQALTITGDAGRLDQVLGNLVANALRHTPAGGQVRLSAEMHAGSVRIRVADSGSGIRAEDLPFIFDRFWRGDRARQKSGAKHSDGAGSTGLGLAITRQLVQAHGGKISVESREGEGSVFTVDLPGRPPGV